MMITMKNQLDLFATSEIELLRQEIADLRESSEAVRKGMFARHDQIKRDLEKIKEIILSPQQILADFSESKIAKIGG
jgi:hypothetical protein